MLADFISNQPERNFILAGGLSPANVADAIQTVSPCGVDVAGGVESSPRKKDPVLVTRFISAVLGSSPISQAST
jgi:phosphoribosylanthranilate isomerase